METRDLSLDGRSLRLRLTRRQTQALSGQRGDLAGHADHRQATRHVRRDFQLQHDVAHEIDGRRARRDLLVEQDDAGLLVVVDAQLERGADHRIAGNAADLGRLQLLQHFRAALGVMAEQHRAGQGEDDCLSRIADLEVRRSGDELLGTALAIFDGRQFQIDDGGIGMRLDFLHARRRRFCPAATRVRPQRT